MRKSYFEMVCRLVPHRSFHPDYQIGMKSSIGLIVVLGLWFGIYIAGGVVYGVGDREYVGMNNLVTYLEYTTPENLANNIDKMIELNFGSVRLGIDLVGGMSVGDPFDWVVRDNVIDTYLAAGIEPHALISPRGMISRGSNEDEWKSNYDYFCRNVMEHYRDDVTFYITGNEPEIDFGDGTLTPQQVYDFTEIAYNAAQDINSQYSLDPPILIESNPPVSPDQWMMESLIQLDIGGICDYIGVHIYGDQLLDNKLGRPWEWLEQYGTTVKPLSVSECGVDPNWGPPELYPHEYRRRWLTQWYVAMKRMGISHTILFSMTDYNDYPWGFYRQSDFTYFFEPEINELRDHLESLPFGNGGFESANDSEHEWVPIFNTDEAYPPVYSEFILDDPSGAHSGSGYLKMSTAGSELQTVRRVAGGLQPGSACTVEAWVYINGSTSAKLALQGFDIYDGDREMAATTDIRDTWVKLTVDATLTREWAVIALDGMPNGGPASYMKWDDVVLVTDCPKPVENLEATIIDGDTVELIWDNPVMPGCQADEIIIERRPYGGVDVWHELDRLSPDVTSYVDGASMYGGVVYTYRVGVWVGSGGG